MARVRISRAVHIPGRIHIMKAAMHEVASSRVSPETRSGWRHGGIVHDGASWSRAAQRADEDQTNTHVDRHDDHSVTTVHVGIMTIVTMITTIIMTLITTLITTIIMTNIIVMNLIMTIITTMESIGPALRQPPREYSTTACPTRLAASFRSSSKSQALWPHCAPELLSAEKGHWKNEEEDEEERTTRSTRTRRAVDHLRVRAVDRRALCRQRGQQVLYFTTKRGD